MNMNRSVFLTLAIVASACGFPAFAQEQSADPDIDPPVSQVEDVVVEGRRGVSATTRFVTTVAPPIGDRALARWRTPVCVGVANMQAEAARAMADRISDWADYVGLDVAAPGCRPNIFVVLAENADAAAKDMVASRRRDFRTGASGSDRGARALDRFQTSGRDVRWWHVSLPINADTERAASRLPGQATFGMNEDGTRPSDFGPNAVPGSPSRLLSRVRQDLQQAVVIIDDDALDGASFVQLTDHVAMVALAQVDPDADTRGFPTILNLFEPSEEETDSLTDWDRAFLQALYAAEQGSTNTRANVSQVADAMRTRLDAGDPSP